MKPVALADSFPEVPELNSVTPIRCENNIKPRLMETGMDPAAWRLFLARSKQAYEACIKEKRQLERQEQQERAAQ